MRKPKNKRILTRIGAMALSFVMAAAFAVGDAAPVFGSDNGVQAKAVSTTDVVRAGSNTIKLNGCVKGKEYVLSVVKGSYKSYSIKDDTLLYIDQKTAEGSTLSFTFPIPSSTRVVVLVSSNDGAANYPVMVGEANIPISEAAITVAGRTYNGGNQGAAVSSVKYRGANLRNGTDFTISGAGKNVGTYKCTITGRGRFVGSVSKNFNINPVGTSLKSLKKGKKKMTVKWAKPNKKYKTQMSGYQIQYSLYSNFRSAKTVSGGGYKKTSKAIKGLQSKKKYYVRIRTYKGSCYSSWSGAKSVVIK